MLKNLPAHQFEDQMLDSTTESTLDRLTAAASFVNITEVFVNDFISATNNTDPDHLRHFSRAMLLHGIHSIFPPPEVSGHQGEDPISQKKLKQGNSLREFTKEILGWLIDGAEFTIQLMPDKE